MSRTLLTSAVTLGFCAVQWDALALNPALPALGRQLPSHGPPLTWVVAGYLVAAGALMPLAGHLADRWGAATTFRRGAGCFALASAACALAPDLLTLVLARLAQGAGAALLMPAGLTLLARWSPAGRGERATGLALGLSGLATALGPPGGGLLTEAVSWRAVFWAVVPLALLSLVLTSSSPPGSGGAQPASGRGPLGATAALLALSWGVLGLRADRTAPALGVVCAGVVGAALVALVFCQVRGIPLVPRAVRRAAYVRLTVTVAVANAGLVNLLVAMPLTLGERWGMAPRSTGVALLPCACALVLGGLCAGRVPPPRRPAVRSAALWAAGVLWPAVHLLGPWWGPTGYLLLGCGGVAALGLVNAVALVALPHSVPPGWAGTATGLAKSALTLAGGVAVGVGPVGLALLGAALVLVAVLNGAAPSRRG
ncbi:MFS transporter [Streptomyces sp. NPDC005438]|uniref:MFS transporter n=1 Tax=Streptomyces sp. NPDC005438 TaxID=3156880 RepID=UPI0033AD3DFA